MGAKVTGTNLEPCSLLGAVAGSLEYDWKEAEKHFRLAMVRDPVPVNVRLYYSLHLMKIGRPAEAVQQAEFGLQEDPLNLLLRINRASYLAAAGRDADALEGYREILVLNPSMVLAQFNLAAARRPLLAERKRLLKLLSEALIAKDAEARRSLESVLAGVRAALKAVKTEVHFVEPKSARSRRTIALPSTVVKSLNRHRVRQLEARLAAGQRWQDSGLVFSTPIGTPLDGRNVTRAFKGILVSYGLPSIRIHDLRHSCATLLLMQGVSPRVVMETLGHSQVSLTLNTYSHVLPALQEDAASKMDAILSRS